MESDANVVTAVTKALKRELYSDFTIRCGDREWKVHRVIICTQSEYFKRACDGSFKEVEERCIALREDEPAVVEAMLDFLYTGHYEESDRGGDDSSDNALTFNMRLYAIADKYCVASLQQRTSSQFEISFHGRTVNTRYDHFTWLGEAAKLAYASETESYKTFREVVMRLEVMYREEVTMEETGKGFTTAVRESPDFSMEYAKALVTVIKEADMAKEAWMGRC